MLEWVLNIMIIVGALRFLIQDRLRFLLARSTMGVVLAVLYGISGGMAGSVLQ